MIQQVSLITCPKCGFTKEETMPKDSCQFFYECTHCKARLKPKTGDCCVFCSYGSVKCPPKQKETQLTQGGNMNTKIKLLLTAVMSMAVLTLSPQAVRAQGMGDSQNMMNNESPEATEVAIHGFCPVCVINGMKVKGKDNFTTEYQGKVYKFAGFDQQKMFFADPDKYVADLDAKFNALKDNGMMGKDNNMMQEGSH